MKAKQIRNQEADESQKYGAWLNARMTSQVNKTTWSAAKQLAATRMQLALETCYKAKEVYVTFRKTVISVKVDHPSGVYDRKGLKALEEHYTQQGYKKKKSAQGITYTIPR